MTGRIWHGPSNCWRAQCANDNCYPPLQGSVNRSKPPFTILRRLFPVSRFGIEYPRVAEFELGSAQLVARRAKGHRAVETGAAPGMTGAGDLFDLDPHGILVAIDAHLDHALRMAGGLALFPQRLARSAEIPRLAGCNG